MCTLYKRERRVQNERKSVAPSCGIVGLSPTVMGNRPSARRAPAAPTEIKAVDPITLKWKLKTERSKPVSPATLATLVAKEDLAQELYYQSKLFNDTMGIRCFRCNGTGKTSRHTQSNSFPEEKQEKEASIIAEAKVEESELLPYDGDLQAAMRAQDRDAIRKIMEHRKKPQSPKELDRADEVLRQPDDAALDKTGVRIADYTGDAARPGSLSRRCCWLRDGSANVDEEGREAIWSYEDDIGWRLFPAEVSDNLESQANEQSGSARKLTRAETTDFSYELNVDSMTFSIAQIPTTDFEQPRILRRITLPVPGGELPFVGRDAAFTWLYELTTKKGVYSADDSRQWVAFPGIWARRLELARSRRRSSMRIPSRILQGETHISQCRQGASGCFGFYFNFETMEIELPNSAAAPAIRVRRVLWNQDPHASYAIALPEEDGDCKEVSEDSVEAGSWLPSKFSKYLDLNKKSNTKTKNLEKKTEEGSMDCSLCKGRGSLARWVSRFALGEDGEAANNNNETEDSTCGICYGEAKYGEHCIQKIDIIALHRSPC